MADSVQNEVNMPELPDYILYIVILSRVLYSGVVTLGILYLLAPFVGIPRYPTVSNTIIEFVAWFGLVAGIGFVVIGVGFKLWVVLSWLTASLFSSELRASLWEAVNSED